MLKKTPYKIHVSQDILVDLRDRLQEIRWPTGYTDVGWTYGADMDYMKELVNHWLYQYDWRKNEAELNRYSHFKADVDGVNIHLIHEKGKGPNPTPIILTHGWPDSFYRYLKVIPMLTDPEKYGGKPEDSFDVIIPSLPGFGFSDHKAMKSEGIADLWYNLMHGLGYEKFAAAGGDAGSTITRYLAYKYPESVTGIHLTDVGYPNFMNLPTDLSEEEQKFVDFLGNWWQTEGAFNMIQSTKPQTLGYMLNDSPLGLAAWTTILLGGKEPFGSRFKPDEQITNIMIYWITGTINSTLRYYLTEAQAKSPVEPGQRIETPTAVLHCTEDAPLPLDWAKRNVNMIQYNEMKAGHFAAWENPEAMRKM
ncbi:MAG: epoxide hydrolase [Bacteroidales bacterium]|nr:epoxide hydrolase [Bacteroidales bacterium]